MPNQNGRLPIEAGQALCETHKLSQVIVIGKTQSGRQVCMTYGMTQRDKENAAIAGAFWERIIALVGKAQGANGVCQLLQELRNR